MTFENCVKTSPMKITFEDFISDQEDFTKDQKVDATKDNGCSIINRPKRSCRSLSCKQSNPSSSKHVAPDSMCRSRAKNIGKSQARKKHLLQTELSLQAKRKRVTSEDVIVIGVLPPSIVVKETMSKRPADVFANNFHPGTMSDMLLTDKYQPKNSSELAGAGTEVEKLLEWLKVWKDRVERWKEEVAKSSSRYSEDCDFVPSRGACDVEDDFGLCNTVVVTGPSGCGKTSTIYSCCKEIGFKVLELNASMLRSSKSMLTQLQEATQSHLVSKLTNQAAAKEGGRNKSSNSRALQKYFAPKKCTTPRTQARSSPNEASLILIDEVEAILQPDVGFWGGLRSLIATSKRPIAIVSTSAEEYRNLDGNYEKIHLKFPTKEQLSTRLGSIAEQEGLELCDSACSDVADAARGDIRHAILSLEFWADAKSLKKKKKPHKTPPVVPSRRRRTVFYSSIFGVHHLQDDNEDIIDLMHNLKNRSSQTIKCLENTLSHLYFHNIDDRMIKHPLQFISSQYEHSISRVTSLNIVSQGENYANDDWSDEGDMLSLAFNRKQLNTEEKTRLIPKMEEGVKEEKPSSNQNDVKSWQNDLSSISSFMEVASECDILTGVYSTLFPGHSHFSAVRDGVEDQTDLFDGGSFHTRILFNDIRSSLQLRAMKSTQERLCVADQSSVTLRPAKPPTKLPPNALMLHENTSCRLDVFPFLRSMCRAEEKRKNAKTTRRFFHYFNSIGLHLPSGACACLAQEYTFSNHEPCPVQREK